MSRLRLLDLFCGAGGAAYGYHLAGFEVVGVDIAPQPNYPFEFRQGDARSLLWRPGEFQAIHASPPCQAWSVGSAASRRAGKRYPELIDGTRELLRAAGVPYVIENVPGAPLRPDLILCGCMFPDELPGLMRRRWFELSWPAAQLAPPCYHPDPIVTVLSNGSAGPNQRLRPMRGAEWRAMRQRAMGIDWMTRRELGQAIPPAYSKFVGEQLLSWLRADGGRCDDSSPVRTPDTSASPGRRTDSRPRRGDPGGSASSGYSHPAGSAETSACSVASSMDRGVRD